MAWEWGYISSRHIVTFYVALLVAFLSPETTLTLRNLASELQEVVDWYRVGLSLGIKSYQLEEIRINRMGDAMHCKLNMLDLWLRGDVDASWSKLVGALAESNHSFIADRIREKYLGIKVKPSKLLSIYSKHTYSMSTNPWRKKDTSNQDNCFFWPLHAKWRSSTVLWQDLKLIFHFGFESTLISWVWLLTWHSDWLFQIRQQPIRLSSALTPECKQQHFGQLAPYKITHVTSTCLWLPCFVNKFFVPLSSLPPCILLCPLQSRPLSSYWSLALLFINDESWVEPWDTALLCLYVLSYKFRPSFRNWSKGGGEMSINEKQGGGRSPVYIRGVWGYAPLGFRF